MREPASTRWSAMRTKPYRFIVSTLALPVCAWSLSIPIARAQSAPRSHVILPPATAGTPLSAQIHAEAAYLAARGDLLESAAIARKINAQAVALEIQNSVEYVDAYFRRRELNRQWRAKEEPTYLEKEQYRQQVRRRRLEGQFQDVLKSDLTSQLNWLLVELSGPSLAYDLVGGKASLADSELNPKLDLEIVKHVWVSDGGPKGSRLVFALSDPKVLQTPWPAVLRHSRFDDPRRRFEAARDTLAGELRGGQEVNQASVDRVLKCIDDLMVTCENSYPPEVRKNPADFLDYNSGKRYLRSLLAQVHRFAETNDASILEGKLRFQGDRLLDLVQCLDRDGLVFAPPQPGGERAYRSLLGDMRNVWLLVARDELPSNTSSR